MGQLNFSTTTVPWLTNRVSSGRPSDLAAIEKLTWKTLDGGSLKFVPRARSTTEGVRKDIAVNIGDDSGHQHHANGRQRSSTRLIFSQTASDVGFGSVGERPTISAIPHTAVSRSQLNMSAFTQPGYGSRRMEGPAIATSWPFLTCQPNKTQPRKADFKTVGAIGGLVLDCNTPGRPDEADQPIADVAVVADVLLIGVTGEASKRPHASKKSARS